MTDAVVLTLVGLATAFLGGGLGAIVSTWMRTRSEQAKARRERQILAADDFLAHVTLALPAIRHAYDPAVTTEKVDSLIGLVDAAHARVARVELLHGSTSDAAKEARLTVGALREAVRSLRCQPPDTHAARRKMYEADDHGRRFAAHVHCGVMGKPFVEPPLHGRREGAESA